MAIFKIFFQDVGRPPSWICVARVWTTHEEYLVAFITVQNLVGIGVVVLKICEFKYYASLAWKCLFTPVLIWGVKMWVKENFVQFYRSRNAITWD